MLDRLHDVTATRDGPGLRTPTEQVVAALWQQVTGREYVADDNFFKTGGDSLAAARVVARLRSFLPVRASLADLFAHPVLADFARHLDGLQDQRRQREQQHLEQRKIIGSERILMTPGQRLRAAAEGQARREGLPRPAGFVPWMVEITAPISDRAITEALQRLVARHESLRVGLVVDPDSDGGHLFVVDDAEPGLVVEDCGKWPVQHRHDLLAERIRVLSEDPVDLSQPPLWRARLYRFSGDHCALVVVTDHMVTDGISIEILNNEFHALLNGERLSADNTRLDFFDWARWQRERLSGRSREELARYWRKRLAGSGLFPELKLPAPSSGGDGPPPHHAEALRLSAGQTAALLRVAAHHGVTSFMICLAAVALSWQRVRAESDTVVHTPVGNRSDPSFAGVVGWLAHTVPIRIVLDPHGSLKDALETVRLTVSDALRHQDMYLDDIAAELGLPKSGDMRPPRIYYGLAETDEPIRVVSGGSSRRLRFPPSAPDRARGRAVAQFETMSGSGVSIFVDISEGRLSLGVVVDPRETDVGFAQCLVSAFADIVAELSRLPTDRRVTRTPAQAAITADRPPSTRMSGQATPEVPGSDGCPISRPC